jgi:hypothetical protein
MSEVLGEMESDIISQLSSEVNTFVILILRVYPKNFLKSKPVFLTRAFICSSNFWFYDRHNVDPLWISDFELKYWYWWYVWVQVTVEQKTRNKRRKDTTRVFIQLTFLLELHSLVCFNHEPKYNRVEHEDTDFGLRFYSQLVSNDQMSEFALAEESILRHSGHSINFF